MANALKAGFWWRAVIEREHVTESRIVDFALKFWQGKYGLHLAGKSQATVIFSIKAGLDALTVARQHAGLGALVPDEKSEHADQVVEHLLAFFDPQVHQHLSVAARLELVTLGFELLTQFNEIENLTVKNNPHLAVGAAHGLHAVFRVHHGQAGVAKHRAAQLLDALLVNTPVLDAVDHLPDVVFRHIFGVDHTHYSTHGESLFFNLILKINSGNFAADGRAFNQRLIVGVFIKHQLKNRHLVVQAGFGFGFCGLNQHG